MYFTIRTTQNSANIPEINEEVDGAIDDHQRAEVRSDVMTNCRLYGF